TQTKGEASMRPFTQHIVMTEFDRHRLQGMLHVLRKRSGVNAWSLDALETELARAHVVSPQQIPATVVTMNSRVRLRDLDTGVVLVVALAFPAGGAAQDASVPVLSPLGLALLGCREGDVMEWRTRQGPRRLRVDAVVYQPEAAGDYFM
ncbi:MAG TPA: GreA/GreB family elongation factor, partial [Polyangiales bacterium]